MFDRFISSLVALGLAFLVWLYVRSRDQEMLDNVPIPVQITLRPGLEDHVELEVLGPSQVPISFTGPLSRMRELRHLLRIGGLRVEVSLNVPEERLAESSVLDAVRVEADDVHPPPGVTPLVAEGRNRIPVKFHRLIERHLPVRLDCTGGKRISQVLIEPVAVLVRGPQEALDHARAIPTQPFALPLPDEATTDAKVVTADAVPLVQQLDGRRIRATPSAVAVRVVLQPQQTLYELADVPVQFLCPANFSMRPLFSGERAGKITLRLLGPAGEETPAVIALIDLGGRKWQPGFYEEPLKLQLPANFRLAQNPPRSLAFQLAPLQAGARTFPMLLP
jgi:hypothetical protein